MCTSHAHLRHSRSWNWDGDVIVHNPVIPNARKHPITNRPYKVDVREFLETTDNAILRAQLSDIADSLKGRYRRRFLDRIPGSFDFRVAVLKQFVSKIRYEDRSDRFDSWLYPEETLSAGSGDCEDRAFLLASLMIASGVSSYCVRVVLGKVQVLPRGKTIDHVWVMYKDESGLWQCIEPLENASRSSRKKSPAPASTFVYRPIYAFNDEHMWQVGIDRGAPKFSAFLERRKRASADTQRTLLRYRPSFGYPFHRDIVSDAIDPDKFVGKLTDAMRSELDWYAIPPSTQQYLDDFASMVANVDITVSYNPLLHFDNGLIEESQALLLKNLKSRTLGGFANACHATADFYSHTSYPYFAKERAGDIVVASCLDAGDPAYAKQFWTTPDYSQGDFALERFSTNKRVWKDGDKSRAASKFSNTIISGRFGQWFDSKGILEHTQFYTAAHDWQGALPHHNEIAVDSESREGGHVLYSDKDYRGEHERRYKAAVKATRKLFDSWPP
jgi:hypothetical protein